MEKTEYIELVNDLDRKRQSLSVGKSKDYATEDILSNFKRMSLVCKTLDIDVRRSPADCARFLLLLKLDRWCNLAKKEGESPVNEAVSDTVMDFLNYVNLAYACEVDESGYKQWLADNRAERDLDLISNVASCGREKHQFQSSMFSGDSLCKVCGHSRGCPCHGK